MNAKERVSSDVRTRESRIRHWTINVVTEGPLLGVNDNCSLSIPIMFGDRLLMSCHSYCNYSEVRTKFYGHG